MARRLVSLGPEYQEGVHLRERRFCGLQHRRDVRVHNQRSEGLVGWRKLGDLILPRHALVQWPQRMRPLRSATGEVGETVARPGDVSRGRSLAELQVGSAPCTRDDWPCTQSPASPKIGGYPLTRQGDHTSHSQSLVGDVPPRRLDCRHSMMLLACLIAAPAKTGPEMNGRWSQNHPSLLDRCRCGRPDRRVEGSRINCRA
jgi:hypothetical protein